MTIPLALIVMLPLLSRTSACNPTHPFTPPVVENCRRCVEDSFYVENFACPDPIPGQSCGVVPAKQAFSYDYSKQCVDATFTCPLGSYFSVTSDPPIAAANPAVFQQADYSTMGFTIECSQDQVGKWVLKAGQNTYVIREFTCFTRACGIFQYAAMTCTEWLCDPPSPNGDALECLRPASSLFTETTDQQTTSASPQCVAAKWMIGTTVILPTTQVYCKTCKMPILNYYNDAWTQPVLSADALSYTCDAAPYTEVWVNYTPLGSPNSIWYLRRTSGFTCDASIGYYWNSATVLDEGPMPAATIKDWTMTGTYYNIGCMICAKADWQTPNPPPCI